MPHPNIIESEAELLEIVRQARTIAVVGMRDESKSETPGHEIPASLQARGYRVVPVNPNIASALGERAYARLAELPERPDIVDVFRRPSAIPALADEILALPDALRPPVVWLQVGIRDDQAAERLAAAGIRVVQDRCLGVYAARSGRRGATREY